MSQNLYNTDAVQEALGYPLTAKFMRDTLGVDPIKQEKRAMYWSADQLPVICDKAAEFFSAQGDKLRAGGSAATSGASQAALAFDEDDEEL